jgi:hypothetical protein
MEGTIPLKHLKNIAGRWKGASKNYQQYLEQCAHFDKKKKSKHPHGKCMPIGLSPLKWWSSHSSLSFMLI